jgi:hypothetical protein
VPIPPPGLSARSRAFDTVRHPAINLPIAREAPAVPAEPYAQQRKDLGMSLKITVKKVETKKSNPLISKILDCG